MNQGIENIRKKGSRIVAEGAHMLPAASLMKAAGVIEQAVMAMGQPGETLLAWLGPAIGPLAFRIAS